MKEGDDDWLHQEHSRQEKVEHEEMKGEKTDGQLSNDVKGLNKRAKMFFKYDKNKDGFLAGADVPRGTLDLLDTNTDLAVSFSEWVHGFTEAEESTKLTVFKSFYGNTYGDHLPTEWGHRDEHHTGETPEDDRHEEHPMDIEASKKEPAAPITPPADHVKHGRDIDPGGMSDEELNAALDKASRRYSCLARCIQHLALIAAVYRNTTLCVRMHHSSPPLFAQDFTKMDKDSDGTVTLEEYKAWDTGNAEVESDFKVLDRNHDGKLTRIELAGSDDHSSYVSHEDHEKQKTELHEK
jgi:hypothetical protein